MTLEIELKYRVKDHQSVLITMARLGFEPGLSVIEEDQYLNGPDRDFAITGEAFRLRREDDRYLLTYKGPVLPGAAKIRTEQEVPVANTPEHAAELLAMLQSLGYKRVAMVKKRRQFFTGVWQGGNVTVCFDTVIGLGSYIELEQVVDEAEADQVAPRLHDLAANLGLTEVEPKSYLRLVLEAAAKARKE